MSTCQAERSVTDALDRQLNRTSVDSAARQLRALAKADPLTQSVTLYARNVRRVSADKCALKWGSGQPGGTAQWSINDCRFSSASVGGQSPPGMAAP